MNSNFSEISLPTLPALKPLELAKILAQHKDVSSNSQFLLLHNLPDLNFLRLRTIDEIIDAIENDRIDSIQMIEWLYCISYKSSWDVR
jgi:hypothetical protein